MNSKILLIALFASLFVAGYAQGCRTRCGDYVTDYQEVCGLNSDEEVVAPGSPCNCACRCTELCDAYAESYSRFATQFGYEAACQFPSLCDCSDRCDTICDSYAYCVNVLAPGAEFPPEDCPTPVGCTCNL